MSETTIDQKKQDSKPAASEPGKKTASSASSKPKANASKPKVNTSKSKNCEVEVKVLKELYLNTETAKLSLDNVIKKTDDTDLRNLLLNQYESYNEFSNKVVSQLNRNGETPKEVNAFNKALRWGTINMSTLFDKTPSRIADMMIQESNEGIISINKELNINSDSLSEDTLNLASDLLSLEQNNLEQLKAFL